jgi:hypothetical protein
MLKIENHPVYHETCVAYADCDPLWNQFEESKANHNNPEFNIAYELAMASRKLHWRASSYVDVKTAHDIMSKVVSGYNNFNPNLLLHLPKDCQVALAREGSVCIYIKIGKTKLTQKMKRELICDECDSVVETTYGVPCSIGTIYQNLHQYDGGYKGEIRLWWD